ncbi:MAG: rhomboid family intramembrane serine protease [Ardenticatenaceae bacterium]|nr:rhomboid family intramembrane serine protease [Ardenticatenaceae bacterium]MCB9445380.1 rhomboid family intramembrane serine protease [Ardenticatenaceae bacterium]
MKAFFRALVSNIIFAVKIILGFYVTIWLVRLLESPAWQSTASQASLQLPFINNLKTAVVVVGGLFMATWGLRFLDRSFFKGRLKARYGIKPHASLNIPSFFTAHLVHGYDEHLYSNTRSLLIFTGVAVLITPDFQTYFLATAVMVLIQGFGVWIFGQRGTNHIGASGMLLAYFSFNITYGLAYPSWRNALAVLLIIFFGRGIWRTLRYPGENTSVAMHLWGFLSGILAALMLIEFGYT